MSLRNGGLLARIRLTSYELAGMGAEGLHVDVVIGAQHPCRAEIETNCAAQRFVCHVQTDRMAEADLAIGAGGSATWERCSMGLPSIILVLAENQNKAAKDLDAAGVLINLGDARKITKKELVDRIGDLIGNEKLRSELSRASLKLVSFSKQNNIAEIMVGHNV